jgi:hypothetical protein
MYPSDLSDAERMLIEPFSQRLDPRCNRGKYVESSRFNKRMFVHNGDETL